ncbi:MAG: B12-binding domain-containing radical SAM protein, partial [Nanoarchaeota archaeon]|nr:B12-binding domain-containing radical SAM protein [Nanoarchaeota archaeon]
QLEFMNNARRAGLLVNGCFVLGLDSDTKESIQETIDFSKELHPDTAQFYPLMVYPITEDYKRAKAKGYLTTEDYSKWLTPEGLHNCVVDRPGLSGAELVKICNKARRQFYLRPKYIAGKLVQGVKNPKEMARIIKAGATFVKHLK